MRAIQTFLLFALSDAILPAADLPYEVEFQRAIRLYPPGDYNGVPVRRFSPITTFVKQSPLPTIDLLEPVEPTDKDIKTLFSEAASFFTVGRLDLAAKRYKQTLLLEPENRDAKAHLYDILLIRSLWEDESHRSEASKRHSEISKQIFKDILLPKEE